MNSLDKTKTQSQQNAGYKFLDYAKRNKNKLIQYLSLISVIIFFTYVTEGRLLSIMNIKTIFGQLVVLFIISIALVFVFSHGNMDISVGGVIALSSMAAAYSLNLGASIILATLVAIVVSVTCYLLNIYIANQFGLMAIISSLAVMFISRGIVTYVISLSNQSIKVIDIEKLAMFNNNLTFNIISLIVIAVIGIILFNFTKIGNYNKAIGDNAFASMMSGVQVNKTKVISYLIAGILIGFASMFSLGRSFAVSENSGMGLEMDVIVALVLGGMQLNGGSKSKISSAIFGSTTLVLLNNGLVMWGVGTEVVSLIKGIIFLAVVYLSINRSRTEKVIPR